jgi:hypothetical protein
MIEKLEPCPYCNNVFTTLAKEGAKYYGYCPDCHARGSYCSNEKGAIFCWDVVSKCIAKYLKLFITTPESEVENAGRMVGSYEYVTYVPGDEEAKEYLKTWKGFQWWTDDDWVDCDEAPKCIRPLIYRRKIAPKTGPLEASDILPGDALRHPKWKSYAYSLITEVDSQGIYCKDWLKFEELKENNYEIKSIGGEWRKCEKGG